MQLKSIPQYISDLFTGKRKLKLTLSFERQFAPLNLEDIPIVENKNTKKYSFLIGVDGSGFSGSSAVTDFLDEFDDCTVWGGVDMLVNPERGVKNGFEVDFFRDIRGIQELEKICFSANKRILNTAIKDYWELIKSYYKQYYPSSFYNEIFLSETKKFLRELIDFTVVDGNGNCDYYAKQITIDEYRSLAKKYIHAILVTMPSKKNLVLDAAFSINEPNMKLLHEYFGDCKLIYVWRDPRDIYTEARMYPGNDWVPIDPKVFVKWYLRDCPKYIKAKNTSLLTIRFEDFVYHYDEVSDKITNFLGTVDKSSQINKQKFFNPKKSSRNIGLYKTFQNQETINYIYNNLKEYCYSSDNRN